MWFVWTIVVTFILIFVGGIIRKTAIKMTAPVDKTLDAINNYSDVMLNHSMTVKYDSEVNLVDKLKDINKKREEAGLSPVKLDI